MIHIHYADTTGEIIHAYHDSCANIPTPHIIVDDEAWAVAVNYPSRSIDLSTLTLIYDESDIAKLEVAKRIREIDAQITAIEATQPRQIREITLGLDDGSAQATLVKSNEMIGLLRKDRAALIANRR